MKANRDVYEDVLSWKFANDKDAVSEVEGEMEKAK